MFASTQSWKQGQQTLVCQGFWAMSNSELLRSSYLTRRSGWILEDNNVLTNCRKSCSSGAISDHNVVGQCPWPSACWPYSDRGLAHNQVNEKHSDTFFVYSCMENITRNMNRHAIPALAEARGFERNYHLSFFISMRYGGARNDPQRHFGLLKWLRFFILCS